ncbi:MAG: hypothetical protein RBQ95_02280 [Paracholeplasma sp.]|uniref:Uncharacterized protein n=1 Tax=Acholeplasma brassicae TaxID=61635 RepID=U4KQV6_9MOLU|nr:MULTISPECIES: hypothetical protein [Paracholeplasma]MDY3195663.1 hypothetical protein [Paracholeplasma sp.]CCV65188.1 hypothetical protein BN85301670 [Paracholeplasma brassicae]
MKKFHVLKRLFLIVTLIQLYLVSMDFNPLIEHANEKQAISLDSDPGDIYYPPLPPGKVTS